MVLPSRRGLAALYVACGTAAGSVSYAFGQSKNLEVFRHASRALLSAHNLYDGSSGEWFKYSPTFALLFLPLAWMPAWLAAALWGATNFGAAFLGVDAATRLDGDDRRTRIALLASLPGVLLATDGDQANLLVAGAILLAFAAFERKKASLGAAAVALGALVKLFPLAAALFALLHRDRERSLFRVLLALAAGVALPLIVLRPAELVAQYAWWGALLRADHVNRGWSLVTVARDLGAPASGVQLGAIATLVVPLLGSMFAPTGARFRRAFAVSVLVFLVLFNHRSEYATFVVSALGVGLWFADGPKTPARIALVALASVAHGPFLTIDDASVTGAFSFLAAHRVYHPLRLVPLTLVWTLVQIDLLRALVGAFTARRDAAAEDRGRESIA